MAYTLVNARNFTKQIPKGSQLKASYDFVKINCDLEKMTFVNSQKIVKRAS